MSRSALGRTIRRCTAVLLLPLSLYPVVFIEWLESDGYAGMTPAMNLADDVGLALFAGAVVYLVVSATTTAAPGGDAAGDGRE